MGSFLDRWKQSSGCLPLSSLAVSTAALAIDSCQIKQCVADHRDFETYLHYSITRLFHEVVSESFPGDHWLT